MIDDRNIALCIYIYVRNRLEVTSMTMGQQVSLLPGRLWSLDYVVLHRLDLHTCHARSYDGVKLNREDEGKIAPNTTRGWSDLHSCVVQELHPLWARASPPPS